MEGLEVDDLRDARELGRPRPDRAGDTEDICGTVREFVTLAGELRPKGTFRIVVEVGVGVVEPLLSAREYGSVPVQFL